MPSGIFTVCHEKRNGMPNSKLKLPMSPLLLAALSLAIPAFYLVLTASEGLYRNLGHVAYAIVALMVGVDILLRRNRGLQAWGGTLFKVDLLVMLGAAASAWPLTYPPSMPEWLLRLAYCGAVFIRLSSVIGKYIAPTRLVQIVTLGIVVLAAAGAGFYWLEPKVPTYADGIWLAFITGATVGYGDLVPSTPAARIFAGFIVLLGYALFSVVTASISALLVGEDEERLRRELHSDMRLLRAEIAALRGELHASFTAPAAQRDDSRDQL